jgi:Glycosyltransferase family 25 (LPS biosynthesis protein)
MRASSATDLLYVVSTPDRPDRRQRLEPEVPGAIWTADWPQPVLDDLVLTGRMTPGQAGCALQHLAVWRDIARRGVTSATVLENDVVLPSGWRDTVARAELPPGWDMLYLGYVVQRGRSQSLQNGTARLSGLVYQNHAYVVSQAGVQALLAADLPGHLQHLCDFVSGVGLERYGLLPPLIRQRDWADSQTRRGTLSPSARRSGG